MRTVQISTPVFAAIWANRHSGEDTENAILARLLQVEEAATADTIEAGYVDQRFNVTFPPNFEISRVFKGETFRAKAVGGKWKLHNNGEAYDHLSAMGDAIKTGIENVWMNWHFVDSQGMRQPISVLRDPSKVIKRTKR